jgi:murein L,D-transpeptidase YcbB/YkuD
MDKLKFALFSIVTLSLLGLLGYWAVNTIQSGSESALSQKVKTLQKENEDLKTQIDKLNSQISDLQSELPPPVASNPNPNPTPTPTPTPTVSKYQDLINSLQKLVNGNVFLKLKSVGGYVGTVQQFLNIYNDTTNKIDNDYGAGTKTAVAAFQTDMGLTADGQAGTGTFKAMIDWLKKQ